MHDEIRQLVGGALADGIMIYSRWKPARIEVLWRSSDQIRHFYACVFLCADITIELYRVEAFYPTSGSCSPPTSQPLRISKHA